MNNKLAAAFSDLELRRVVQSMSNTYCPGEDGFGINFFEIYWDIVAGPFCDVGNHVLQ